MRETQRKIQCTVTLKHTSDQKVSNEQESMKTSGHVKQIIWVMQHSGQSSHEDRTVVIGWKAGRTMRLGNGGNYGRMADPRRSQANASQIQYQQQLMVVEHGDGTCDTKEMMQQSNQKRILKKSTYSLIVSWKTFGYSLLVEREG